jgi:hypothetical protein
MSLLNASNSGWYSMGSSVTNIPTAASMATRPCWTSASRHCFMVARGVPVAKPRGSNPSSNGGIAPGRPNANFDSSGTHPLSSARTEVKTRLLLVEGAKAAALLRRVTRMVNFIVIDLLLIERILILCEQEYAYHASLSCDLANLIIETRTHENNNGSFVRCFPPNLLSMVCIELLILVW